MKKFLNRFSVDWANDCLENGDCEGAADAHYTRGIAYSVIQDYEQGINHLSRAIELVPDFASAYQYRGIAFAAMGKQKKAIADLQKAAQLFLKQGNLEEHQTALSTLREVESPD